MLPQVRRRSTAQHYPSHTVPQSRANTRRAIHAHKCSNSAHASHRPDISTIMLAAPSPPHTPLAAHWSSLCAYEVRVCVSFTCADKRPPNEHVTPHARTPQRQRNGDATTTQFATCSIHASTDMRSQCVRACSVWQKLVLRARHRTAPDRTAPHRTGCQNADKNTHARFSALRAANIRMLMLTADVMPPVADVCVLTRRIIHSCSVSVCIAGKRAAHAYLCAVLPFGLCV